MKFAVSTHLFVYARFSPEIPEMIKNYGFDFIELWCAMGHVDFSSHFFNSIKKWCENGVRVVMGHAPFYDKVTRDPGGRVNFTLSDAGESGDMALSYTTRACHMLEQLGAEVVVIHTGFMKGDLSSRQEVLAERIVQLLKETRLKIALETEPHILTSASSLMGFINQYFPDEDKVGVCVDVGHANVMGGAVHELEEAGERLLAVHASDNSGDLDAHLSPGEGTLPWDEVFSYLNGRRWGGVFSFEIRDGSRGERTFDEANEKLKKCRDFLSKTGNG